ncbi:MAG: M50 family metallopeptidase [candidate division KSB1 bacterium]
MGITEILAFITDKLLPFIFVLGILVFIHELGHFLAAKWAGIRVERFSLGFPPRMFGKKIGDTDYCISWIPLGGYVKMAGMLDESFDQKVEGKPDEFSSKPIWKRALVIAAGPLMNLALAVLLFASFAFFWGVPEALPVVKSVAHDSPAAAINLQAGDRIVRIDAQDVKNLQEVTAFIQTHAEIPLLIVWERAGQRMSAEVTPRRESGVGVIGIKMGPSAQTRLALPLSEALHFGLRTTWREIVEMGALLSGLVRSEDSFGSAIVGPVGIFAIVGTAAQNGFESVILIIAVLSLNLGIFNLLPIPVLDGGHLLFLGLESIMRRPLAVKVRIVLHQIAMALLLALMVFVTIHDISR